MATQCGNRLSTPTFCCADISTRVGSPIKLSRGASGFLYRCAFRSHSPPLRSAITPYSNPWLRRLFWLTDPLSVIGHRSKPPTVTGLISAELDRL
ncbi:Uncharacterised protein [Vibrio cholerae]|nr:Uncharacterised protein [Vibrio cholerae]